MYKLQSQPQARLIDCISNGRFIMLLVVVVSTYYGRLPWLVCLPNNDKSACTGMFPLTNQLHFFTIGLQQFFNMKQDGYDESEGNQQKDYQRRF